MEGVVSWTNTPQMALLERYLDVMTMRQTLISTNIANVDTPGYARRRPDLNETPPVQIGTLTLGTGVHLQQITSLRDSILVFASTRRPSSKASSLLFSAWRSRFRLCSTKPQALVYRARLPASSTVSRAFPPIRAI
jgi:hypothetical protein